MIHLQKCKAFLVSNILMDRISKTTKVTKIIGVNNKNLPKL